MQHRQCAMYAKLIRDNSCSVLYLQVNNLIRTPLRSWLLSQGSRNHTQGAMPMPIMPVLPHDIIVDVLSRLPVKSLMRFRCVCKPWRSLISDPQFAKMHLNRAIKDVNINRRRVLLSTIPLQSIDYEADDDDADAAVIFDFHLRFSDRAIEIVGSCNGLICLIVDFDIVILWNPSTRDAKELPKPSAVPRCVFDYGLGYDSSIDDYKVVRVARPITSGETRVEVFNLNTNSWRRIRDIHPSTSFLTGPGTFLNGALHWLVRREIGQDRFNVIISFDLAAEKFQEVVPLPDHDFGTISMQDFRVLGGYLSVLYRYANYLEVWVMREYGVKASWTKLVTISSEKMHPYEDWLSPLCFSKNDEVLMDVDGRELVMYNLKEDTFRNLKIHGDYCVWFEMVIYVESLVSPNGNDGTDERRATPSTAKEKEKKLKNREER